MFRWIADNAETLIAAGVILFAVGIAVFSLVRDKKKGRKGSGCPGNCAACGMCCGMKKDGTTDEAEQRA